MLEGIFYILELVSISISIKCNDFRKAFFLMCIIYLFINYADVKFFLPSKPILQDIIAEDQHVVLIGYGDVTFPKLSSGEVRSPSEGRVNRTYDSLELTIPFLTTGSRNNDIDSKITLFLSRYTSSENLYFDPNVVLPERTKAEVLSQTENGTHVMLEFQHGDFKFKIRGEIAADCEEPEDHVESDVETYVEELSMSQTRPKYSICDPLQADMDDDFCRVWNKYKKEIIQSGANVCQRWSACSPIDCAASFTIVEMSNEFKKYMALDDCHLDAIEAATTSRRNQIGLKFPCF